MVVRCDQLFIHRTVSVQLSFSFNWVHKVVILSTTALINLIHKKRGLCSMFREYFACSSMKLFVKFVKVNFPEWTDCLYFIAVLFISPLSFSQAFNFCKYEQGKQRQCNQVVWSDTITWWWIDYWLRVCCFFVCMFVCLIVAGKNMLG